MAERVDRNVDARRLASWVPHPAPPPRVPERRSAGPGEQQGARRRRDRRQVRLERVDQVVEDRDRPWLARLGRPEREHAADLDDVLADDETPTQEVDAAALQSGELAPA